MRPIYRSLLAITLLAGLFLNPVSAQIPDDTTGAREGTAIDTTPPLQTTRQHLNADLFEGFEDITLLVDQGWALINNSEPLGINAWFQGTPAVFSAFEGDPAHYIGANYNSASGTGTISNWLITPERWLKNGDTFIFYTRTVVSSAYPDRLEVRLSTAGASTDVGSTSTSVGDFGRILLSINPELEVGGYPSDWTQYLIEIDGLTAPVKGRIAFRYFVTDSGPSGNYGNYIGIDSVDYIEGLWTAYLPKINN